MIESYNKITFKDKVVFGQVIATPPVKTCAATTPDEAYLLYIKEGECSVFSEDKKTMVKQGQSIVLQGMYVGHMTANTGTGKFEALSVRFHPEILRTILEKDLSILSDGNDNAYHPCATKLEISFLIDSFFSQVQHFFNNQKILSQELISLKIKEILLLLLQSEQANPIKAILNQLFNPQIRSFREVVEAHSFSDLTVKELAHLTNLSISSFKRYFKKEYRTTPNNYLWQKRLNKAKHLLENSDLAVSDIAFQSGFKTVSHFSKKFREQYGKTPTDFKLNLSEHSLTVTG